jgi:hypothetical protein
MRPLCKLFRRYAKATDPIEKFRILTEMLLLTYDKGECEFEKSA